jgi:hypothetical protein
MPVARYASASPGAHRRIHAPGLLARERRVVGEELRLQNAGSIEFREQQVRGNRSPAQRVARMFPLPLHEFTFGRRKIEPVHQAVAALERDGRVRGRRRQRDHENQEQQTREHAHVASLLSPECTAADDARRANGYRSGRRW